MTMASNGSDNFTPLTMENGKLKKKPLQSSAAQKSSVAPAVSIG